VRHMDLFSGIAGFAIAARNVGWQTVGFCEIDPYCQKVLKKHWPDVPIYDDIRELSGEQIGSVDVISGGYPCQPFSVAGERRGEEDDRHLWPEFARIIRETKPAYVVCENVAGHISMGLDEVLSDLEGLGYTTETFVIPACAVGAFHRRDRIWVIAYSNSNSESDGTLNEGKRCWELGVFADTLCERQRESGGSEGRISTAESENREEYRAINEFRWPTESPVCRRPDGVSPKLDEDRLRALGNSIVPQIAEVIFRAIEAR
jgi:DNA (cytosine-5)-methyltransferase 1